MPDHVLTARIYFGDQQNADNAFEHVKALAEHSAAHDRQVDGQVDTSWLRLHECHAHDGDTTACETTRRWVLTGSEAGEDGEAWAPGQVVEPDDLRAYDGTTYRCLQGHTTQQGWEPSAAPSLWEPA